MNDRFDGVVEVLYDLRRNGKLTRDSDLNRVTNRSRAIQPATHGSATPHTYIILLTIIGMIDLRDSVIQ